MSTKQVDTSWDEMVNNLDLTLQMFAELTTKETTLISEDSVMPDGCFAFTRQESKAANRNGIIKRMDVDAVIDRFKNGGCFSRMTKSFQLFKVGNRQRDRQFNYSCYDVHVKASKKKNKASEETKESSNGKRGGQTKNKTNKNGEGEEVNEDDALERVYITWPTQRLGQSADKKWAFDRVWLAKEIGAYKTIADKGIPTQQMKKICGRVVAILEERKNGTVNDGSLCSSKDDGSSHNGAEMTRIDSAPAGSNKTQTRIKDLPQIEIREGVPPVTKHRSRFKAVASLSKTPPAPSEEMDEGADCESSSPKTASVDAGETHSKASTSSSEASPSSSEEMDSCKKNSHSNKVQSPIVDTEAVGKSSDAVQKKLFSTIEMFAKLATAESTQIPETSVLPKGCFAYHREELARIGTKDPTTTHWLTAEFIKRFNYNQFSYLLNHRGLLQAGHIQNDGEFVSHSFSANKYNSKRKNDKNKSKAKTKRVDKSKAKRKSTRMNQNKKVCKENTDTNSEKIYLTWPTDRIWKERRTKRKCRRVWLAKYIALRKDLVNCGTPRAEMNKFCEGVKEILNNIRAAPSSSSTHDLSAPSKPKKPRLDLTVPSSGETTIAEIAQADIRSHVLLSNSSAASSSSVAASSLSEKMDEDYDCESSSSKTPIEELNLDGLPCSDGEVVAFDQSNSSKVETPTSGSDTVAPSFQKSSEGLQSLPEDLPDEFEKSLDEAVSNLQATNQAELNLQALSGYKSDDEDACETHSQASTSSSVASPSSSKKMDEDSDCESSSSKTSIGERRVETRTLGSVPVSVQKSIESFIKKHWSVPLNSSDAEDETKLESCDLPSYESSVKDAGEKHFQASTSSSEASPSSSEEMDSCKKNSHSKKVHSPIAVKDALTPSSQGYLAPLESGPPHYNDAVNLMKNMEKLKKTMEKLKKNIVLEKIIAAIELDVLNCGQNDREGLIKGLTVAYDIPESIQFGNEMRLPPLKDLMNKKWPWLLGIEDDWQVIQLSLNLESVPPTSQIVVCCPRPDGTKFRRIGQYQKVAEALKESENVSVLLDAYKNKKKCEEVSTSRRRLGDLTLDGPDVSDTSNWHMVIGNNGEKLLCLEEYFKRPRMVVPPNPVQVVSQNDYSTSSVAGPCTLDKALVVSVVTGAAAVSIGMLARKWWRAMRRNTARRQSLATARSQPSPQQSNVPQGINQNATVDLDARSKPPEPFFVHGSQKE
eukprot:GHVT01043203.1.p1 GENE.GHVT01043203.1~~GHVT01043203.1.p1  ORF type:complete len:1214 (-),score=196.01 GHVT01043203.1:84-3725(-)